MSQVLWCYAFFEAALRVSLAHKVRLYVYHSDALLKENNLRRLSLLDLLSRLARHVVVERECLDSVLCLGKSSFTSFFDPTFRNLQPRVVRECL